jgi:hypothetical protein
MLTAFEKRQLAKDKKQEKLRAHLEKVESIRKEQAANSQAQLEQKQMELTKK